MPVLSRTNIRHGLSNVATIFRHRPLSTQPPYLEWVSEETRVYARVSLKILAIAKQNFESNRLSDAKQSIADAIKATRKIDAFNPAKAGFLLKFYKLKIEIDEAAKEAEQKTQHLNELLSF